VINRRNAVIRLWPLSPVVWLALACSGSVDDPADSNAEDDAPPVIIRDSCDDNPLLAGCPGADGPDDPVEGAPGDDDIEASDSELELARAAAENVLRVNCGQCHGPQLSEAAARAGMNYINDIDALVNEGKIVPLAPEDSPVVRRMQEGSMPPLNNDGPRPSARDIEVVADFVDNPLFWPEYRPAESCAGQLITFDELYATLVDDVRSFDSDDREFIRYVTLTNRYNAGVCGDTLDRERFAIVKLVNMLSTDTSVTPPTPIDDEELIYRIDIRDYNWDRDVDVGGQQFRDGWEAIIAASPYAVPFVGDQAEDLRDDTVTDVPVLNADAMLDVAALGDLYYGLIEVDVNQSLADFVANDLGIDVDDNFEDGDVVRAGTTRSAISREDRVVERHDLGRRRGVFWQSFDFAADDNGSNIFTDPFGFNQGGTEAIFSLPNGLLGFIIADENDNIVGESNLLLDTFQDDFVARTSVSCSNCHAQGFNLVTDEVRPFVDRNRIRFQRDDFELVTDIYLEPADFAAVISEDSQLYQQALQLAGLPITGGDPVASAFVRFNQGVDLATAAGELGVTEAVLEDNINLLDPRLIAMRDGVLVDREDFTDSFEESLCVLQLVSDNSPDFDRCSALLGN
jgi:mono/diheme cytochrome c family protein